MLLAAEEEVMAEEDGGGGSDAGGVLEAGVAVGVGALSDCSFGEDGDERPGEAAGKAVGLVALST